MIHVRVTGIIVNSFLSGIEIMMLGTWKWAQVLELHDQSILSKHVEIHMMLRKPCHPWEFFENHEGFLEINRA